MARWSCDDGTRHPPDGLCVWTEGPEPAKAPSTTTPLPANTMSPLDDHLQCVRDAYLDRPNLRLTPSQAQRMFELEPQVCVAVLDALLNEAFLLRTREGLFVRHADWMKPANSE